MSSAFYAAKFSPLHQSGARLYDLRPLDRLRDVICQAVAQGVLGGLQRAQDTGNGDGQRKRCLATAYAILGITLAACLGVALLLAAWIAAPGGG